MRKYGKDFQAIAEMLGTKTESQVRTFYLNYRRKYNLDAMLEEYEKNIRAQSQEGSGDEEAVDGDGHAGSCEDATESVAENQLTINDAANTAKQSDDDIMEVSWCRHFVLVDFTTIGHVSSPFLNNVSFHFHRLIWTMTFLMEKKMMMSKKWP